MKHWLAKGEEDDSDEEDFGDPFEDYEG